MVHIYDPVRIRHPKLREFAYQAAWIATGAEAASDVEDLLIDVPPAERVLPDFRTPWPWAFDAFVVALSIMTHTRQAAELRLEDLLAGGGSGALAGRSPDPDRSAGRSDPASGRRRPRRGCAPAAPSPPPRTRQATPSVAAPRHEFLESIRGGRRRSHSANPCPRRGGCDRLSLSKEVRQGIPLRRGHYSLACLAGGGAIAEKRNRDAQRVRGDQSGQDAQPRRAYGRVIRPSTICHLTVPDATHMMPKITRVTTDSEPRTKECADGRPSVRYPRAFDLGNPFAPRRARRSHRRCSCRNARS
jgi:hypothetical protein